MEHPKKSSGLHICVIVNNIKEENSSDDIQKYARTSQIEDVQDAYENHLL